MNKIGIADRVAASMLSGEEGWEAPEGRRRTWRRKNPDGTYEYRDQPPEEHDKPAEEDGEKAEKRKVKRPEKREHQVELTKDELKEVLTKGHFSVVSAGRNPSDPKEAEMKPDDEFFHHRHEMLKSALEQMGAEYTEVVGHYGGSESSFMVFHDGTAATPKTEKSVLVRHGSKKELDDRRKKLEELGKAFNQDSVLHGDAGRNSIVFTTGKQKGKECGGKGWKETPGAKDFYTDVKLEGKVHTKFNLNVDGCFKKGLLSSERVADMADAVAGTWPRKELVRTVSSAGVPVEVWYVDGEYVRTYLDEEFTNFGQHYRFPFVPVGEFWIDEEGSRDEVDFFVGHLLVEHELMAKGKPYSEAIVEADKVEVSMRREQGDLERMKDPGRRLVDPRRAKLRLVKELESGVEVWLVDGRLVRSALDVDYTEGGHEYVYEFVPEGEVWIDNDVSWHERAFVILHELHERNRMAEGMPYSKAHAESSALELRCRRNPDELHDAMVAEGW